MNEIAIDEKQDEIIKSIIDMQEQQAQALNNLASIIDAMRENIVTNMRFELHDAMMECIIRGYMTPEEYERVTEKMRNYVALRGNHGIKAMYEQRFIALPIKN